MYGGNIRLLRLPWRRVCGPLPVEKDQDIEIFERLRAGEHAARVREVPSEAHFELTFPLLPLSTLELEMVPVRGCEKGCSVKFEGTAA